MKTEQSILNLIHSKHSPIDFVEITQHLKEKGSSPNKTTIYRNLDKMEKDGLIKKVILSDQKQFWEISQNNQSHQHYHLICQKCESIECKELERNFTLNPKLFQIQKIELNFYGFCHQCV
jgi:Fur family transcriptional regulator, ferric uptake regulator